MRPAPRDALIGLVEPASETLGAAGRFNFFSASAASNACFLSVAQTLISIHVHPGVRTSSDLFQRAAFFYVIQTRQDLLPFARWHRFWSLQSRGAWAYHIAQNLAPP